MRTLGIAIDGVIRDFNSQFHKTYVKTFIHNDSLVSANIPSHMEARNGMDSDAFVAQEKTEEQERAELEAMEKKEREMISLPVNSDDLLNHYVFEEKRMDFINDPNGNKEDDLLLTPKDALNKFIYDDYPFQIFGMAQEYEGANELVNRIQGFGKQNGYFNTVLLSTAQKQAIPATYNFLGRCHSRAKSVVFVDREEDKWNHCDVLIDANPRAIQAVSGDKYIIRILRDWNQYDDVEFTFNNLKEVLASGVLDKLFK